MKKSLCGKISVVFFISLLVVALFFAVLIVACKFDNQLVVKNVVDAFNSGNESSLQKSFANDFVFESIAEQLETAMLLQLMDSLHGEGYQVTDSIVSVSDTLIVSELTVSTLEDLSLEVKPLRKYKVKWHFSKKKIDRIQVAGYGANNAAYRKALEKARAPFEQWVEEKEPEKETSKKGSKTSAAKPKEEVKASEEKLLDEYAALTPEEKEAVQIREALSGIFFCSKCFFEKLDFRNDTTVVMYDSILGLAVNYSYTVEGRTVTVKNDKKEFVFELVDWETLAGKTKGATGEYKKLRESK
ncbi:MAG: hypothetical protein K9H26_14205 [Prolixibacteraceae bacterium]|nr:hypothetical protein [Prolixibacteraceae bacterium]